MAASQIITIIQISLRRDFMNVGDKTANGKLTDDEERANDA